MSNVKTISIFGSTGSIGCSACAIIEHHAEKFNVLMLSAHSNVKRLSEQAIRLKAKYAVIVDEAQEKALKDLLKGHNIEVKSGAKALLECAQFENDISLHAIVGMAGLSPLLASIPYSKAVAIANKEPLVSAGALVIEEAKKHSTQILPVDSEHNAIFQVFETEQKHSITRIILTASGGPFLRTKQNELNEISPEQALQHPNWDMGNKISIDSATMMNKALEIIEAYYLFNIEADKIDVLIHPQSIVHSMVEYEDGSILAQMGASDMQTPISNVLHWPKRLKTPGKKLDFHNVQSLTFEEPDENTLQGTALKLAYKCLNLGAYACIALNAANEMCVDAFLEKKIRFPDIINIVEQVVSNAKKEDTLTSLDDISIYDQEIRNITKNIVFEFSKSGHSKIAENEIIKESAQKSA